MSDHPSSIVWLRRDLRLHDHKPIARALGLGQPVLPIFVFDTHILKHFPNKQDHRLAFIADALCNMHAELAKHGSGVVVVHGRPQELVPKIASALGAARIICGADWEPTSKKRDHEVAQAAECEFTALCDHLILPPDALLNQSGEPYKVFTPYSRAWRKTATAQHLAEHKVTLQKDQWAAWDAAAKSLRAAGISVLDPAKGAKAILKEVGYEYSPHEAWPADEGPKRLRAFIGDQVSTYGKTRDILGDDGTSRLSPYLRFGLVSIREAARLCVEQPHHDTWLNELIWREFYTMILHFFPETPGQEFQEKYRDLSWRQSEKAFQAWQEGKTGFPVVDAAMRQLKELGWMHNRARMIVASFLTKDLLIDWRKGEEHFAQHLMDYELSSNVGGWQWAASTGTDAQPYFRIFNPTSQSKKFDPDGVYIKRWVPELKDVPKSEIHEPANRQCKPDDYPTPIVDHKKAREEALSHFKKAV